MKLEFLEVQFVWPDSVKLNNLRDLVVNQLMIYGKPLRWSITDIYYENTQKESRKIKVDAVVIKHE